MRLIIKNDFYFSHEIIYCIMSTARGGGETRTLRTSAISTRNANANGQKNVNKDVVGHGAHEKARRFRESPELSRREPVVARGGDELPRRLVYN